MSLQNDEEEKGLAQIPLNLDYNIIFAFISMLEISQRNYYFYK